MPLEISDKQYAYIKARRKYVNDIKKDTGEAPPMHLSLELHVYNALIALDNAEKRNGHS